MSYQGGDSEPLEVHSKRMPRTRAIGNCKGVTLAFASDANTQSTQDIPIFRSYLTPGIIRVRDTTADGLECLPCGTTCHFVSKTL